jgi:hypothetical protein
MRRLAPRATSIRAIRLDGEARAQRNELVRSIAKAKGLQRSDHLGDCQLATTPVDAAQLLLDNLLVCQLGKDVAPHATATRPVAAVTGERAVDRLCVAADLAAEVTRGLRVGLLHLLRQLDRR